MRAGGGRALRALAIAAAVIAGLIAGCRGPGTAPRVADPFSGGYPTFRDEASGITAILGTPDLGVGTFRVAIALTDRTGLIRLPAIAVEAFRPGADASADPAQRAEAVFRPFPDGSRGLYDTSLAFDRAGTWSLRAAVPRADGTTARITVPLTVAARASAPAVGAAAPATRNRTAKDVPSLDRLTTGADPDPVLYQHRIADSLAGHRPIVVVFASPAFCTNPLCGPQVEEASELAKRYADRADFVHIDLFENPHEIRGDLSRAVRTPILKQWGLRTDEWTFVIGADGKVAARFEAFVPRAQIEAVLQQVLARGG